MNPFLDSVVGVIGHMSSFKSKHLWMLCTAFAAGIAAQVALGELTETNVSEVLRRLSQGADPHEAAVTAWLQESTLKRGGEGAKLRGAMQILRIATSVYSTLDPHVATNDLPLLGAVKVNERTIPPGTNPRSLTNLSVRVAYEQALASHEQAMARALSAKRSLQEADYCVGVALRVLQSSTNQNAIKYDVDRQIESLPGTEWAHKRIRGMLTSRGPDGDTR